MFWTYLLRCADGSFHCGHTDDLERRSAQHANGETGGCTQHRRPVSLAWQETFPMRIEALEAERRIKGWSLAKQEALIVADRDRVPLLARNRQNAGCPSTSSGRTVGVGA